MIKVTKNIVIALLIIVGAGTVAFLKYAYTLQYRLDGTSWYLRFEEEQTEKTFTKYGEIEGVKIYGYGIEKLSFQTFDAKGISFKEYIDKPHMTLKRMLGEYESKNLTKEIVEYNLGGTPLTKFIKYRNNLIAIGIVEDSENVVDIFKNYKH